MTNSCLYNTESSGTFSDEQIEEISNIICKEVSIEILDIVKNIHIEDFVENQCVNQEKKRTE